MADTVTVVATSTSEMNAASSGDVTQDQLARPSLLRPGALLENVPGLIVTQHSGEGKANQYFLRAFNLDHGTDLATQVDAMPINLPTHAHGQGYTDLNFLIPELVADLHFRKGPYYADEGDFATAGAVRMDLVNSIADSATLGFGADGYRRALLLGSSRAAGGTLLAAADLYHNDGPFVHPDDYHRLNGLVRYHQGDRDDFLTVTAMAYSGIWDATDQVPQHLIDGGMIGRFGSLEPSDGGHTSRESLSLTRMKAFDGAVTQFSAYVIRYKLDLWSNFTYALKDPVNGDQMLQRDDRVVYGFDGSRSRPMSFGGISGTNVLGLQGRVDDIRDIALDATVQRRYLASRQDAAVTESSGAVYFENSLRWSRKFRSVLRLRADAFRFNVRDKKVNADGSCDIRSDPLGCDTGTVRAGLVSPKLGVILGPWADTSVFLTVAQGYHSNDARGVTRSEQGSAGQPVTPLTRATSAELGVASGSSAGWRSTLDLFLLKLRSELVFQGDAGVTVPSGATTRSGIEWGNSFRINDWVSAELNAAFSSGRFDHATAPDDLGCGDAAPSHPCARTIAITGRYVPNSPTHVIEAAVTGQHPSGGSVPSKRGTSANRR